jgi:hypothetical protein
MLKYNILILNIPVFLLLKVPGKKRVCPSARVFFLSEKDLSMIFDIGITMLKINSLLIIIFICSLTFPKRTLCYQITLYIVYRINHNFFLFQIMKQNILRGNKYFPQFKGIKL